MEGYSNMSGISLLNTGNTKKKKSKNYSPFIGGSVFQILQITLSLAPSYCNGLEGNYIHHKNHHHDEQPWIPSIYTSHTSQMAVNIYNKKTTSGTTMGTCHTILPHPSNITAIYMVKSAYFSLKMSTYLCELADM